ncbi:NUDIX domain-containing protein [Acetobacteraceae bacterium]|nr:NUDIX domain-containing protein [Candidatus Parcubacteria bacterium]
MSDKVSHDSETPAKGQQVITVAAFIHHDFDGVIKVFQPRRAMTKKFLPGIFELPGGHVDFGEDIIEGLKREVMEENEMHINVGDPFAVFTYTNEIKGSHSIEVVYFAKFTDPIENIRLYPEDHSEFRWLAESEIADAEAISDEELRNVKRGFELLKGQAHNFG